MAVTSLWHKGRLKDLIAYVETLKSRESKLATVMGCVFVCQLPWSDRKRRICFRHQLPQRDCRAAGAFKEKAVRQGKRIYIKVLNPVKLPPNRRIKSAYSWQRKCGENSIRSSSLPILIKTIYTTIFALIPYPFWTEGNTTIPKPSSENSVRCPTGSAGNMAYRLSKNRIKRHQGRYGWTRKAASRQGTMFTGKM